VSRVTGIEEVLRNLDRAVQRVRNRAQAGLIRAAVIPMRDANLTPPLTPLVSGNLRSSIFLVTQSGVEDRPDVPSSPTFEGEGDEAARMSADHQTTVESAKSEAVEYRNPVAIFGYSAVYARYQHEGIDFNFTMPGAGAKWLQAAIARNESEMLDKIRIETRKAFR